MDYKQQFSVDTGDPLNGTLEQNALLFHIYNKSAALQEWTEFAKKLWGYKPYSLRFISLTSPCSPNRNTTFLQNWPNWGHIMELILATSIVMVYQLVVCTSIQRCYI